MQEKFKNYWNSRTTWSKISDLIFIALLITLFIPSGRMAVGGAINRVKAMALNPSMQADSVQLNPEDLNWQLYDMNGKTLNLTNFEGKVIFLNLWATWCPPCVGEMPEIQELYNKFKDHPDIAFVAVSNERNSTVSDFIKKRGFSFPVYTTKHNAPSAFASRSIPTTFVISKSGKIKVKETGAYNWGGKKMVRIIDKLLKE